MNRITKIYLIFLLVLFSGLLACHPVLPVPEFTSGEADFTNYLAVGNSLTAGFSDAELYLEVQRNSYPALIAAQMQTSFKQPLVKDEYGVLGPHLSLNFGNDCLGNPGLRPVPVTGIHDSGNTNNIFQSEGPFNNMGVPGIRAIHMGLPGYGLLNPYFGRFQSSMLSSVLNDAMLIQPTFFTCWLGSNDILTYALNGGNDNNNPFFNISDKAMFESSMNAILSTLTANGAKGVVANIPDISGIPFFNLIPYDGLILDQAGADALTQYYASEGIVFHAGNNPFIIEDQTQTSPGFRPMQAGELLLMSIPQDSLKCGSWGSLRPIPAKYVLNTGEVNLIKQATQDFNNIIANLCDIYNLPLLDMNHYFESVESGIYFNGINFSSKYISGASFSLDGIHPTQRGYAMIANEFIRVINNYYHATIPWVDVGAYPGVKFP